MTQKSSEPMHLPMARQNMERALEVFGQARIVRIETVRSLLQPNVLHTVVTDSDGWSGLGETFFGASAVEAHIHDALIHTLGKVKPPAHPIELSDFLSGYVGYAGSGAEVRARSSIDIALWDIAAKRHGVSLSQLLNPGCEKSMATYNTCSGELYVNQESRQASSNWGLGEAGPPAGQFEDLWAFMNEPGRLARELVDAGFSGMKVWPFDLVAEESGGASDADLTFGLKVLDEIRSAVGSQIDLYLELHSLWQPEAALRLIQALEPFDLSWVEDPIRADNIAGLKTLRAAASMPLAVGENLGAGLNGYPAIIQAQAVDTMIMDLGWCGGLTAALPLQEGAGRAQINTAYHDCTGPVSLAVATHVSLASEFTTIQEVARAFINSWYPKMAEGLPTLKHGLISVSNAPGHGVVLSSDFLDHPGTVIRSAEVE